MMKCKKCGGAAEKIGMEIDKTAAIGSIATSFADPLAGLALGSATLSTSLGIYKCKDKECGYEWKE